MFSSTTLQENDQIRTSIQACFTNSDYHTTVILILRMMSPKFWMTRQIILQNKNHPIAFFKRGLPGPIYLVNGNTWDEARTIEAPPPLSPQSCKWPSRNPGPPTRLAPTRQDDDRIEQLHVRIPWGILGFLEFLGDSWDS